MSFARDIVFLDGPMKGDKSFQTLMLSFGDIVYIRVGTENGAEGTLIEYKVVDGDEDTVFMEMTGGE